MKIKADDFKGWKPKIDMASCGGVHLFAEVDILEREICFVVRKPGMPEVRCESDEMDLAITQYNYWIKE